jgi:integrase
MAKREKKYCQSVRKRTRADGAQSYLALYELPPDSTNGTRRQVSLGTYATPEQANAVCRRRAHEEAEGRAVDPSRLLMGDLAARWLAEDAATTVRPQTLHDYAATVRNHVLPRLGSKRAQSLTPSDISAYRAAIMETTGCRTTQLALQRVKQILSWAHRLELVQRNVAEAVPEPTCPRREGYALSLDEARRFIEASFRDALSPLWLVYLTTGFRRSEAIGLRWRDVDFARSTLTVRQQVVDRTRALELGEPKSRAAKRTIEVDPVTLDHLSGHLTTQQAIRKDARHWQDMDLVFCTSMGTLLHPNNLYRQFKPIVTASGVYPRLTLHDLRHTHATHLILAGVPITDVSRRLGHERVSMTIDLYGSHLVQGHESGISGSIQGMLFPFWDNAVNISVNMVTETAGSSLA